MLITVQKKDLPSVLQAISLNIDVILEKELQDGYLVSATEAQSILHLGVIIGYENLKKELNLNTK